MLKIQSLKSELPNLFDLSTPKRSAMLFPSASSIIGCSLMIMPVWNPEHFNSGITPSPTLKEKLSVLEINEL